MGILTTILFCTLLHLGMSLQMKPAQIQLYHTSKQFDQQYLKLKRQYNNYVNIRQCQKSGVTYKIIDIDATQGQQSQSNALRAVVTCNIHARQLLTSELCLYFVKKLLATHDGDLKFISSNVKITMYYLGNQMHDAVLNGQYCRRTDSNDVDINRNFPTGYLGENKGQQTNPGPSPLSEPFSQCIEQEVNSNKPDIFLDLHTGQFSLYTFTQSMGDQEKKQNVEVLNSVAKQCPNCRVREDEEEGVMYADMKKRKQIKWSNLFQIYGAYNQAEKNNDIYCWTMFNPRSKRSLDYYLERSNKMLINYFKSIINFEHSSK